MKPLLLFVIICLLATHAPVVGQVIFNDKYEAAPSSQIPFGEVSGINGKTPGLQSLSLTIYYRTKKEAIPISVHSDGSWAGVLPALPAKAKVLFVFDALRKANQADTNKVRDLLKAAYSKFSKDLTQTPFPGLNDTQAKATIDSLYKASIPVELALFKTSDQKPLNAVITDNFQKLTASESDLDLIFKLDSITAQLDNERSDIENAWKDLKDKSILNRPLLIGSDSLDLLSWKSVADSLVVPKYERVLDSLRNRTTDATLIGTVNFIVGSINDYAGTLVAQKRFAAPIDKFNQKQREFLAFVSSGQFYVSTLQSESIETTEILKYASIDVTGLAFPNFKGDVTAPMNSTQAAANAYAGFFFMISPYFQDFLGPKLREAWRKRCGKIRSETQGFGIAPSLGVALFQVVGENPKPIYFLGASLRLNEAFRLNAGWSFFKLNKSDPQFQWMPGFGVSLRLSNLGDLMRLFSSTTSELTNVP
jgi:hypothetical protein